MILFFGLFFSVSLPQKFFCQHPWPLREKEFSEKRSSLDLNLCFLG